MATDYSSVDSFVAAYLANCESQAQTQQQGQNAHGLPFAGANGLQPAFQQVIGVAGQVHSMGGVHLKYEQGAGDVYMQPYDQTAHQMCMNHVAQQRDWQLQQQQQQQLELLLQQQQQQQHHAQQQAQQHQQQVLAAAVEVQGAGSGGRPATPKSSSWPGSSSSKQLEQPEASATTGKRSSRSKTNSRGRSSRQEQDAAAAQQAVTTDMDRSFAEHNLVHSMSAPPQPSDPAAAAAAFAAAQVGGPHSFPAYGQAGPLHDQPGNLAGVLMMQQQAEAARQQQAASAHAMQMQPSALQEEDEPDMSHLTVMQVSCTWMRREVVAVGFWHRCAGACVNDAGGMRQGLFQSVSPGAAGRCSQAAGVGVVPGVVAGRHLQEQLGRLCAAAQHPACH
jgi:hypothetical protein